MSYIISKYLVLYYICKMYRPLMTFVWKLFGDVFIAYEKIKKQFYYNLIIAWKTFNIFFKEISVIWITKSQISSVTMNIV